MNELLFARWPMGKIGSDVARAAALEAFQIDGDDTALNSAAEALECGLPHGEESVRILGIAIRYAAVATGAAK